MRLLPILPIALPLLLAACASQSRNAWQSWRDGDVEAAERAACELAPNLERLHLLFNCAFAKGDYAAALDCYAMIGRSYQKLMKLDELVIDAYLHLGRVEDAAAFARDRRVAQWMREALDVWVENPFRVELEGTSVLPFVSVPIEGIDFSDSLPGVAAQLEGREIVAHFDSGGSFLAMSPDRARKMGIELIEGQRGFAALAFDRSYFGIAKSFLLGDALLENVPVTALPQLKGATDRVYFGTNILERLFATVDFPARRLILSPRGDGAQRAQHLAFLGTRRKEVPFYLWSDHFMFARGAVGDEEGMNFFIDSGLFMVAPDDSGKLHRCSLITSRKNCLRWGMGPEEAKRGYFECPLPISLGPVEEDKLYILARSLGAIAENFGGLRIDGLLSNGFLSQYAWSIDFDRRVYIFSRP